MLKDFREGDKVTCLLYGRGIVDNPDGAPHSYPVKVCFENGMEAMYTGDGHLFKRTNKSLFHGHNLSVRVSGEEKPRRAVRRYVNLYYDKERGVYPGVYFFKTKEEALRARSDSSDGIVASGVPVEIPEGQE